MFRYTELIVVYIIENNVNLLNLESPVRTPTWVALSEVFVASRLLDQ